MNAKIRIIFPIALWGTIALFVKNIPLPTSEIALLRAIIAALALLAYKRLRNQPVLVANLKQDLPLLFLSGAAMGFNWILLFQAYHYTTVSLATLSYYFAPVLVMLASPLLFKEKLTAKQLVCFSLATAGLIMVIGVDGTGQSGRNLLGIGFGLGAAVLYASVVLLNKVITSVTGIDKTLIQLAAAAIVLLPYVAFTGGLHVANLPAAGLLNLLILGLVHTGICYCLYFTLLKDLTGQEAAILSYLDPFTAILVSITILHEPITAVQLAGGLMILVFTLLNEIKLKP